MRKYITGFVAGAIVFGTVAFAATYTAKTASFKTFVNGSEFKAPQETLVVNGSTYMPLKAVGDALGVAVKWNSAKKQVEIGTPPVETKAYSRANPAPLFTEQKISKNGKYDDPKFTMSVKITESIRGQQAAAMVADANMFNNVAPAGYEYVVAKISMTCQSISGDKAVNVGSYDFKAFTGKNAEIEQGMQVPPEPSLGGQLFAGATTEGYVIFTVKQGEGAKIVYGMAYDGSGGIWFEI